MREISLIRPDDSHRICLSVIYIHLQLMTHETNDRIAEGGAVLSVNQLPTVCGAIPPSLAAHFQNSALQTVPELTRLPQPRERCPLTGSSRSWLIEHNDALPPPEKFLFSVRKRGKMRGATFVNVAKLMAFMRKAQGEDGE